MPNPIYDVVVNIKLAKPTGVLDYFGTPLLLCASDNGVLSLAGNNFHAFMTYDEMVDFADANMSDDSFGENLKDTGRAYFRQDPVPQLIYVAFYDDTGETQTNVLNTLNEFYDQLWYILLFDKRGNTQIAKELMIEIETRKNKIFIYEDASMTPRTTFGEYSRTAVIHESIPSDSLTTYPDIAWAGAMSNYVAGSATWKFKELSGVLYENVASNMKDKPIMTASNLKGLLEEGGNAYLYKAGQGETDNGQMLDGEWIDIMQSIDWVILNMEYALQVALHTYPKLPYDNRGISYLEGTCQTVLQTAYGNGMIAEDDDKIPMYSVDFAPRSETLAIDRYNREYKGGKFQFSLAGAIHEVEVNGTIEF